MEGLEKHLKPHSGEKSIHCNECPKAFSEGGDLKYHLRSHSGDKPFPCIQCPKSFSKGGDMKNI
jgi:uncharacterized Zn-finger protein